MGGAGRLGETPLNLDAYAHIGVIGGGAWGTALAVAAARAGRQVTLWARESAVIESIKDRHENTLFLTGVLPPEAGYSFA